MFTTTVLPIRVSSRTLAPSSVLGKGSRPRGSLLIIGAKDGSDLITWPEVGKVAQSQLGDFTLMPGKKPSTAPNRTLPTLPESFKHSKRPVVLFRDTNAWCPYCERVWLALEEKGIIYDTVLIDLRDKPDWYVDLVPTKLVPAAKICGEVVWESKDILLALEKQFPGNPLLPHDNEELKAEALMILEEMEKVQLDRAGFRYLTGGTGFGSTRSEPATADQVEEYKKEYEEKLQWMEDLLEKRGGPFLLGFSFSMVDIMFISFMERHAACMPVFRNFHLVGHPSYPRINEWFAAINRRPAYHKVRSDPDTLVMLFKKLLGLEATGPAMLGVSKEVMDARKEAAGKIQANLKEIVADILKNSGLSRHQGSPYGTTFSSVNGYAPRVSEEVEQAVKVHLQRLCQYLLTGSTGPKVSDPEAASVGAAALAFFRNRASSPRDMSARAVEEFRSACDAVLRGIY